MKIKGPSRLSWKLLFAIVPMVVLGVSGIVWLQYQAARREILNAIDTEMRFRAQRTALNIADQLDQSERDLGTLAESSLITDYYRNVDFQLNDEAASYRRELELYLRHFAERNPVYAQILYLDARGGEICSIRAGGVAPAAHARADYFLKARETPPGGRWISPVENLPGAGRVVYFSKPVYDELRVLKGVLVLCYDLSNLRAMLRNIEVGPRGRAYIQTENGVTLEGRAVAAEHADLISASSALRRRPWIVSVEAPRGDFLGPLRTIRDVGLLTSLLGLALLVGVLLWLVRSITRPIQALVAGARAVGAGDLSHRILAPGSDELGALSGAFNEMAEHLDMNRQQTAQLQSQLIQAEKLSAVGQLISSVAHELNNPLGAISGYVQLAQLDDCSPLMKEDLKHVFNNVLRCRKVVDNLLFFVRQSQQERKKVDLNECARSALELLEYRLLKTEGVRVSLETAEPAPEIAGDFQQIVQILVNLIGNACDAMETGVSRPDGKALTIRTGAANGKAFIEIEDNGAGIPPDLRERIFQPFFTTKEPGRGTGLGLPICRQIAQEHGGDILVHDGAGGKGSVFRLELPLGSAEEFDRISLEDAPAPLDAVPGKRVLVADDEADIAEVIARLLRDDRDEVVVAHNGAEALTLLDDGPYDLVVSDIEMEHAKGTDLYAELAARGAFPATKMLFVTGDILNPKVLEFLSRTKSEYAVKPFDIQELRQAMRRLLGS